MGWEVGGRFKREGTRVNLWLTHVVVWQKRTQHCKAIVLKFKINLKIKKKEALQNALDEEGCLEITLVYEYFCNQDS